MASNLMLSSVRWDLNSARMSSTECEVGNRWASGGNGSSCSWLMALAFSEASFFLEAFSVANARVRVKMSPVVSPFVATRTFLLKLKEFQLEVEVRIGIGNYLCEALSSRGHLVQGSCDPPVSHLNLFFLLASLRCGFFFATLPRS